LFWSSCLLIAELRGDEIIVKTLGFYAAYAKSSDAPQLVLRRCTDTNDHELLARAWQAALAKARELGWICDPQSSGFGPAPFS
jgi:hypothetical protein